MFFILPMPRAPLALHPCFWQALSQMPRLSAEVTGHAQVLKEKCGWCVQCRASTRKACLLVAAERVRGAAVAASTSTWAPSWNPASDTRLRLSPEHARVGIVRLRILQLEELLQGLLDGPWEDFPWRREWKRQVRTAESIRQLRQPLQTVRSFQPRGPMCLFSSTAAGGSCVGPGPQVP